MGHPVIFRREMKICIYLLVPLVGLVSCILALFAALLTMASSIELIRPNLRSDPSYLFYFTVINAVLCLYWIARVLQIAPLSPEENMRRSALPSSTTVPTSAASMVTARSTQSPKPSRALRHARRGRRGRATCPPPLRCRTPASLETERPGGAAGA